jgi:hypothetical protein
MGTPAKTKRILALRSQTDLTLAEIGSFYGITAGRVRQIATLDAGEILCTWHDATSDSLSRYSESIDISLDYAKSILVIDLNAPPMGAMDWAHRLWLLWLAE